MIKRRPEQYTLGQPQTVKIMTGLFVGIALMAGGIMDGILEILKGIENEILRGILFLLSLFLYFPALAVYFVCYAVLEPSIRRNSEGNSGLKKLKSFEYYISMGGE